MWNKGVEVPRLVALRQAVRGAFGIAPPLTKSISLIVRIHIGPVNSRSIGDLDNFLTGICDGLQASHHRTPISDRWSEHDCEAVHPRIAIAILDDVEVLAIDARKVLDGDSPWYSLELIGE